MRADREYLVVNPQHEWGELVARDEMLALVRRYKGGLLVIDYTGTIDGFKRAVGTDYSRTFDLKEVAAFGGVSAPMAQHLVRMEVFRPSVQPCRGKGHKRLWSWQGAFWCGLAGALLRQRVPLPMLRKLADGFSEGETGAAATATAPEPVPCGCN